MYICSSDSSHLYKYVTLFNEKPVLEEHPSMTTLTDSEAHQRIRYINSYSYWPGFTCHISSADACLNVSADEILEIVSGEVSGIPADPTVKDGPGAGDIAVRCCYPLIIRIKSKSMKVEANWSLVP